MIIPAKKNSVRLKNKNLRKINGKTLVENSIVFCKKFKKISNIVLSTDSEKLKYCEKKSSRSLIHERQKKFSGSKSSTLILINRIIKWYRSKFKKN